MRAVLLDRVSAVKRDGLGGKDLANQAYLFRAALSELRAELTLKTRNESATIQSSTAALRREVDSLAAKVTEDIGSLKNELQMELDNRKNETKADVKRGDLSLEELHNKFTIALGEIRTEIEQAKWDNTRRGVAVIGTFVLLIVASMELRHLDPPGSKRAQSNAQQNVAPYETQQ